MSVRSTLKLFLLAAFYHSYFCSVAGEELSTIMPTADKTASFETFDQRAREGERLNVVFFGGSLTWGANSSDPELTSYRALMADYLRQKYPKAPFTFYDAAIGGTGSELGIFRLDRDVLPRHPDLVFLDFTANDGPDPYSLDSYEVLLRDMIGRGIPVVQVYFGFKGNFLPYAPEKLPGYEARLKLVEPYQTGCGNVLTYIHQKVASGAANLDVLWGIDPSHPDDPGYRLFFEAARDGFEQAIREKRVCRVPAQPVFADTYEARTRHILVDTPLSPGWHRAKTYRTSLWFDGLSSRWMGDVAACDVKDRASVQPLTVDFSGTFVALFGEANQDGLGFRAFIDGKPISSDPKKTPLGDIWNFNIHNLGVGQLFVWRVLSKSLPPGRHTLSVEPVFPDGTTTGQLRIESVCSAGE